MAASVNTTSSTIRQFSFGTIGSFIGSLLLIIAFVMVAYRIYQGQPSKIIISADNLSINEQQTLDSALNEYEGVGFFTANLPELKDKVIEQDWVGQVNIERKWNEGIVVTALPREPIARFGSNQLIDADGTVFRPIDESDLRQNDLTMLQGDENQSYLIMQQMQQVNQWYAPLNLSVADMILTPRMTWVIIFNDGLRVIVDNESTSQKLMNLSELLQNQLRDKRKDIVSIDLRYKNGFAIDWQDNVMMNEGELMSLSDFQLKNGLEVERR